jgi:hypothetical protein
LKKKFDLKVGCTNAGGSDGPSPAANSPRKGAASKRGPVKAAQTSEDTDEPETKSGNGAATKKTRAPRKRAVKSAVKVEATDSTDDAEATEDA